MQKGKVVVVGAGCAGLSATYTLAKQGYDVVAYEAANVAGGRCRSVNEDGWLFSAGAGSTEPQWDTTFTYLKELGIQDKVVKGGAMSLGFVKNGKIYKIYMGSGLMNSLKHLPDTIKFLFGSGMSWSMLPEIVKVFGEIGKYTKKVDTKTHDFSALLDISDKSTEEFGLKYGGKTVVDWFFYPYMAMMVLARPSDISIAHPISLFSLMSGMCSLDGGMGLITAGLYEKVKDKVKLSTPVKKIVIKDNKATGVETDEGFVPADYVICCLDAHDALKLMPDLPEAMRKPLETVKYSSVYYYQFGLEKHVIPETDDTVIALNPPTVDSVLSYTVKGNLPHEKPLQIGFTRGWEDARLINLTPEQRRRKVIQEIQKIYPNFPDEPPKTKVFRWDRAVNTEPPGQFRAIHELIDHHMYDVKGLYLAGEYLFLIACTEGALSTGKKAALKVIEDTQKN